MYFTPRRYDLAKVGRYKLNRKLGVDVPMDSPEASVLSQDDIAQMIRYLCALHAGETSIPGVRDGEEISSRSISTTSTTSVTVVSAPWAS